METKRKSRKWVNWGRRGWQRSRRDWWRWNTGGRARLKQMEMCTRTVKHARNSARIERVKETNRNAGIKREAVRCCTIRDIKKDWQAKRETAEMYIPLILSFCAATLFQCADYESIIWDWQPCSYSIACQTHSQPPSFSLCAHTIAVWWRPNDWRENGMKRERITEKHTLGEAGDVKSVEKNNL